MTTPLSPQPAHLGSGAIDRLLRPAVAIRPTSNDLALMRVVAILQYVVGGITLVLAAMLLPWADEHGQRQYLILGAVALVFAVIRWLRPAGTIFQARLSNLAGLGFIGVIVAISHPVGATPVFYLWPVLTAAYFLRRRDLVIVLLLFAVTFGVALWGVDQPDASPQLFVPVLLVVVVVTGLVRLLRESLAELIRGLEHSVSIDHLTGLANRAAFEGAMAREIGRARRGGLPLSVVALDLDHFKAVNDTHGHAAGDRALRRCADLLASECRGIDVPARIGGEEFVVILPDTALDDARRFAERVRRRLEDATRVDPAPLTVSGGVAGLAPGDALPEHVVQRADAALYDAKRGGRNRVVAAPPGN